MSSNCMRVSTFIRLKNLDNVGCDARLFFSRTALKTGSKVSSSADITFSYNPTNKWLRAHQMTINQKTRDIQLTDMLEVGKKMGIRKRKCMEIISRISKVVADFEKYATEAKIREKTYCDIRKVLDQNRVEIDS